MIFFKHVGRLCTWAKTQQAVDQQAHGFPPNAQGKRIFSILPRDFVRRGSASLTNLRSKSPAHVDMKNKTIGGHVRTQTRQLHQLGTRSPLLYLQCNYHTPNCSCHNRRGQCATWSWWTRLCVGIGSITRQDLSWAGTNSTPFRGEGAMSKGYPKGGGAGTHPSATLSKK